MGLALTEPMPSMPVSFWAEPDGSRLRADYFGDFPGVGDTATGSRSPPAGRASSTAAATPPSTAAASAGAPRTSTLIPVGVELDASNPDGWAAITAASLALGQPHLPNGLAGRLPSADSSIYVIPAPDELAGRAAAVVEAAGWFGGRPDDFAVALGQEPELAGQWPGWLANLILDLGAAGLGILSGASG